MKSAFGLNTITPNLAQFWFSRSRFGNFHVKEASHSGGSIVENIKNIIEIVESDRHVRTVLIVQKINIAQKPA